MKVSKLWVGILIYMYSLTSWAKEKMSSKYWRHGEKRPQRLDLSWTIYDLSFDLKVSEVLRCQDVQLWVGIEFYIAKTPSRHVK